MILPAGLPHAALLAELHQAGFPAPWSEKALTELLAMPGAFAFVIQEEAEPVGFVLARVAADEAEIVTLAVIPDNRRSGLGRRLMDKALDEARRRGAVRVFLEVAENNRAARRLYENLGFAEVGRRRKYYGDVDALVLARPI
jgi:ribosomal-protein-alanine N-acetyltransferase